MNEWTYTALGKKISDLLQLNFDLPLVHLHWLSLETKKKDENLKTPQLNQHENSAISASENNIWRTQNIQRKTLNLLSETHQHWYSFFFLYGIFMYKEKSIVTIINKEEDFLTSNHKFTIICLLLWEDFAKEPSGLNPFSCCESNCDKDCSSRDSSAMACPWERANEQMESWKAASSCGDSESRPSFSIWLCLEEHVNQLTGEVCFAMQFVEILSPESTLSGNFCRTERGVIRMELNTFPPICSLP